MEKEQERYSKRKGGLLDKGRHIHAVVSRRVLLEQ